MKNRNASSGFSWLLVAFLCLYIGLTAVAVTGLIPAAQPQLPPTEPTATQPVEPDSQGLFDRLFSAPDWQALYRQAGEQDGKFEGAAAYDAYMQRLVGDAVLTWYEVYTDLPNTRRYLVFSGQEKIAAFTMTGGPQWEQGQLELYYEPSVSVTVEALPEHTVYVNGVALEDKDTIRTAQTLAESYLPENLHGYRRKWQRVEGLLTEPQILVLDENGAPVEMEQDAETGMYRPVEAAAAQMTEAEKALAREAAVADANYAIGAISNQQLKTSFDENAEVYKMLVTNPRNLQKYTSASIDENSIEIGQFYRYSDTMFSVNVKLTQKIIRTTGTLKTYQLDKTYFFTLTDRGYRVTAYTTEDVTQQIYQVCLTFVGPDQRTAVQVSPSATQVAVPEMPAPEGQVFLGWATHTANTDGTVTMTVRILPDGTVLGDLEPMTLYPVYQNQ